MLGIYKEQWWTCLNSCLSLFGIFRQAKRILYINTMLGMSVDLLEVGSLSGGTWIGWTDGPRAKVWGSTKLSAGSCTWRTTTLCNTTGWWKSDLKAVWQTGTWGYLSIAGWTWAISTPRWPRRPTIPACIRNSTASRTREWLSPCTQLSWGCNSNTVFSLEPLTARGAGAWPKKGNEAGEWSRKPCLMRSGWWSWGFLAWRKGGLGRPYHTLQLP